MKDEIVQQSNTKTAYSCYFEVKLAHPQFGLSRVKHNQICNQLLMKQLVELSREGIELSSDVSNATLIENIKFNDKRPLIDLLFGSIALLQQLFQQLLMIKNKELCV